MTIYYMLHMSCHCVTTSLTLPLGSSLQPYQSQCKFILFCASVCDVGKFGQLSFLPVPDQRPHLTSYQYDIQHHSIQPVRCHGQSIVYNDPPSPMLNGSVPRSHRHSQTAVMKSRAPHLSIGTRQASCRSSKWARVCDDTNWSSPV